MTDDARVGGLPTDEPVHDDESQGKPGSSSDDAHQQERTTAEGWRGAGGSSASDEVAQGLEHAQEQPGFGREGS